MIKVYAHSRPLTRNMLLSIQSFAKSPFMVKLLPSVPKARRLSRYTAVRLVSRLGDYMIANGLFYLYGATWFYPAIIFGTVFNVVADYVGQKFWVFQGKSHAPIHKASRRELFYFLVLRAAYALPALLAFITLYEFFNLSFLLTSTIVMIAMMFVSFKDFEALFSNKAARTGGIVHRLLSKGGVTRTH